MNAYKTQNDVLNQCVIQMKNEIDWSVLVVFKNSSFTL